MAHACTNGLKPPQNMRLASERHCCRIHVAHTRILHRLGIDLVAMRPRLVGGNTDEDGLVRFEVNALRKGRDFSDGASSAFDLDERQRTVLAPDFAEQLGVLAIVLDVLVRDRNNETST